MYDHAKPPVKSYPDDSGDPCSRLLMAAVTTTARATGTAKATADSPRRVHARMNSTAAIRTRFGRIRIAIAAATPDSAASAVVPAITPPIATAHAAAAGTSLIGCTTMYENVGLVATIHADARPTSGPTSCRPIQ